MAAGPWQSYDHWAHLVHSQQADVPALSYKLALFLSTSNAADLTQTVLAGLTNQHANANGYTTGGVALASPTVTQATRDSKFTCADKTPAFTASGGSIVFRYRVIYVLGTIGAMTNPLVAMALGDATDVDVTIPNTESLNEIFDPVKGIFILRGTV